MFWQVISGFDASLLVTFVLAGLILNITPGADFVFVTANSVAGGAKRGIAAAIGINAGIVVHVAAAAAGLSALLLTYPTAYAAIRYAGAIYLLYLAWQAFRAGAANVKEGENLQWPWRKLYSRGIIMNITNPKVAIFFLAFLPQFADPARGSVTTQMLLFGALFIIATLLVFGSIAWFAGFLGEWLKGSLRAQVVMNRIAGTVFAGLALRLAVSER